MIAVSLKEGEELVKLFLQKGADVNAKSMSPSHQAILFLKSATHLDGRVDFSGQTALHFVASKNNLDIARLLFDANPAASTRVTDKRGQYPIHRAAAVGSVPMVELFIKHKSPLNASDDAGQTPLHHAVAEGHGTPSCDPLKSRKGG